MVVKVLLPVITLPDTNLTSSIRTTSGTSPSGTQTSFNLNRSYFCKKCNNWREYNI